MALQAAAVTAEALLPLAQLLIEVGQLAGVRCKLLGNGSQGLGRKGPNFFGTELLGRFGEDVLGGGHGLVVASELLGEALGHIVG